MWVKLIAPRMSLRPMDSALKARMSPPLSLLVLGALTPPTDTVSLADENVERVRLDDCPDLVGITVKADTFVRACEIARAYRVRGIPVVFGGIHPTTCPEQCARHADSVVIGEAEGLWPRILEDGRSAHLQTVYRCGQAVDLADSPIPRWELLQGKDYLFTNTICIGRGCPWSCSFCYSSAPNVPNGYRMKPIANILAEIASLPNRHVMFIDDNFIGNPVRARRLLRYLLPLGLTWHTAVSADIGRHDDILDLMVQSGCQSLFIGFESTNEASVRASGKRQNKVRAYGETIRKIHERGMMVNASVVFGFDSDDPGVFRQTVDWLTANRVETMTAHILTPYPGTRLFRHLEAEGRIIDRDLSHYNTSRVVFRPRGMTPAQLRSGYLWSYREFYSWRRIFRRAPVGAQRTACLLFNVGYRRLGKVIAALGKFGMLGWAGQTGRRLSYPAEQSPCEAGAASTRDLPARMAEARGDRARIRRTRPRRPSGQGAALRAGGEP